MADWWVSELDVVGAKNADTFYDLWGSRTRPWQVTSGFRQRIRTR